MKKINVLRKLVTVEEVIAQYGGKNPKILNIGSGAIKYGRKCTNLDKQDLPGVDIIADAHKIPEKSGKYDIVVLCASLLCFENPPKVIQEVYRVLKVGGIVVCDAPFVMPYCGSNSEPDYFRFTKEGLKLLFSKFKILKLVPSITLGSALVYYIQDIAKYIFRATRLETPFVNMVSLFFYPLVFFNLGQDYLSPYAYILVGKKCKK